MAPHVLRERAREILRRALGDPTAEFRHGQWEAIDALVNRRHKMLVVERTGWGKSAIYFIATRLLRDRGAGPTLIVSPLLALMRNQMEMAVRLNIRAISINSTNQADWPELTEQILSNEADAILISPERLANAHFNDDVLLPMANHLGLLVVDEAHCISDWGHDFRPDYRLLVNVLKRMPPNMSILGTTATANNRVIADVRHQLGDIEIQRGPLMRDTLALQTLRLPDQAARLAWLADHVPMLPGTGIVYTLTKRDADQVAEWLSRHGIAAKAYYSDVNSSDYPNSNAYRLFLEAELLHNRIKVLVATTALGMGYDKPDLAFAMHYQAPSSIVAYYQQVGRAGRSIGRAVGVLLAGREDAEIQEYFRTSAFPSERNVEAILRVLADSDGLTVRQLEQAVNLRYGQLEQALKFLSVENPAPVLREKSTWYRTPVRYALDRAHIEYLTSQREQEWRELQAYVDTAGCLMQYLARALDDPSPAPCGKCSNCTGVDVVPRAYAHELATQATRFLRQAEFEPRLPIQVLPGAFAEYGFSGNLPGHLRAEPGRVLSTWGDAGWGHVVMQDKHAGHFRDELADAVADMVLNRWRPSPGPTWVTCVPSLTHPDLVPDLARRVAERLKLPFIHAVQKVQPNQPQKLQQNRYYQCANLDGVFRIADDAHNGAALLVDDIVDSGWTMVVVAALLRRAGVQAVWPVALAASSPD
ncbi:MAG: RecQ family ATP-dependent DNA helicase [Chloroflexi bacterium]|nr:RecQ family ATP-dependent DNA helicase [Chloroflexota bacterium]